MEFFQINSPFSQNITLFQFLFKKQNHWARNLLNKSIDQREKLRLKFTRVAFIAIQILIREKIKMCQGRGIKEEKRNANFHTKEL